MHLTFKIHFEEKTETMLYLAIFFSFILCNLYFQENAPNSATGMHGITYEEDEGLHIFKVSF